MGESTVLLGAPGEILILASSSFDAASAPAPASGLMPTSLGLDLPLLFSEGHLSLDLGHTRVLQILSSS